MSNFDRAFPSSNDADKFYNWLEKGITVREYFAAKAMQGLITANPSQDYRDEYISDVLAAASYVVADAMLKERENYERSN